MISPTDLDFDLAYEEMKDYRLNQEAEFAKLRALPKTSLEERKFILSDSKAWLAWRQSQLPPTPKHIYFVTLTRNEQVPVDKWLARVRYELTRTYVVRLEGGIEKPTENIHVHLRLATDKYIDKQKFKTFFTHYGWVDFQVAKSREATELYVTKGDYVFKTLEQFDTQVAKVLELRN